METNKRTFIAFLKRAGNPIKTKMVRNEYKRVKLFIYNYLNKQNMKV